MSFLVAVGLLPYSHVALDVLLCALEVLSGFFELDVEVLHGGVEMGDVLSVGCARFG